ncbi:MSCRAMM family protein, partial [Acutalibacter intestini]|uniref:MSCRAMM family protein n=1 Tax=Acutalibacter intestini TaxID=3093659 RepID=UPI002AC93FE9
MQKNLKRALAFLMTVILIFSVIPMSAFATESAPDETASTEAPTSEPPAESDSTTEVSPELNVTDEPVLLPETGPSSPGDEPAEEPDSIYNTELATVEARQVWPALQRAKARAASGVGAGGVLQMGYYCFPIDNPNLVATLGNKYIGRMPAKSMLYNGKCIAAYCLDQDLGATADQPYTWADVSKTGQETIAAILAVGFQWNAPDFWHGPSDEGDKWAVTQLLVWEAVKNHVKLQSNGLYSIDAAVDADFEQIAPYTYNATKFLAYYREVKQKLTDFMKIPSFASKEASKAETITMRWDGSKYSATVTDTNAVLSKYRFQGSVPGVTITTSGNTLTLSSSEPILTPKTSSRILNSGGLTVGKGAVAVWQTSDPSQQDFATYNADGGEPVGCYIKVKTDAVGSAGLVKTSEDGKVEGIQFQITGSDGSSTTKTTDASGSIDIDGLPIYAADGSKITYTATEINVPNKYVKPESQTFQLTEGQTASIQFENKLKRWRVTVTKTDDRTGSIPQGNGSLAGAKYGVYQGNELVKEYTTDEKGQFTTDYFPYGEDWTLREISAGEGYLVSDVSTQLCEIPAGSNNEFNDNTANVTDTVMRGGVSVVKRDSKTGERPQGDADFSGIQFEIVNKSKNPVEVGGKKAAPGEVALTLTTDSEGKASTAPDALPYGSYILHESATNESMLNTAPNQLAEITENRRVYPFFMDNEVVRGGVLIEKRDLESLLLTPLGGASLDGTLFEITNKSKNAVYVDGALYQPDEVCLTIEVKDGIAQSDVRALPYGSYELAESKPGTGYLWTDKTIRPFDVLIDGSVKEYR